MDCFAALAMTAGYEFRRSRDALRPRFALRLPSSIERGRREDRVHAAPAVPCAICAKKNAHEHTGTGGASRPSLRNGFTAYFVLSPENGSFATVVSEKLRFSSELNASTATSGPHDFAVRIRAPTSCAISVHRIPPRVRDVREPPLSSGETGGDMRLIWAVRKRNIFARRA